MKVTTCSPSGYGDHYGAGEHQYCREEYQTQAYKVPTVDTPLDITVDLTNAEPVKTCVTKEIEIDEVVFHPFFVTWIMCGWLLIYRDGLVSGCILRGKGMIQIFTSSTISILLYHL